MKKIFSVPLISTNARKQSEFYGHSDSLMDYSSSSIDLTDDKRIKLEQLQNRLSVLYEELDKVLVKEEELTHIDYQNKKRKVEPISNFNKSTDNLTECKRSFNSLGNNFYLNGKLNKSDDNLGFKSAKFDQDELDKIRTSDNEQTNETKEVAFSKFYYMPNESNTKIKFDINHNQPDEDGSSVKNNTSTLLTGTSNEIKLINSVNSPVQEQNGKFSVDETELLTDKINDLKEKLRNLIAENEKLKSKLSKTIKNEKEIKLSSTRLEEKIRAQKDKIDQLQIRLTESVSNHDSLKSEHEKFKIEMQLEREKFTNFVIEEAKLEQRNNQEELEQKLKEKDDLIKKLVNEINDLKENLKNKSLTVDLFERNKLLSSQKVKIDEEIQNISIYQKNNIPELFMINLDSSSIQDYSLSSSPLSNKSSSIGSGSPVTNRLTNKQMLKNLTINSQNSQYNQSLQSDNQTIIQLNNSVKEFCTQINSIQKEMNFIEDEEERRKFMIRIEDFVLKNMKRLVSERMDTFFDNLQLHLASLKFEIIQFALDNEKKRNQLNSNSYNRKSGSSIEWIKLLTSNLTSNVNQKHMKSLYTDSNNNQQQLNNLRNRNLRNNNIQSRAVERRMIELKRSIETYLKSYLARILLEMQEQNS